MNEQQKQIRFINSRYHDMFTIPDGANIIITRYDGEKLVRPCEFMDEYHTRIGNEVFHICEFAEHMEAVGNTYEPEYPEKVENYEIVRRMDFDDRKGVALGYNPASPQPFVTWTFMEKFGDRQYEGGRYRKSLSMAQKDFAERAVIQLANLYAKIEYQFDHTDRLPKPPTKARSKLNEPER